MAFKVARLSLPAFITLAAAATGLVTGLVAVSDGARALSIELKDVAADRVDRQRAAAEGALPLPGTPNVALLDERLKEKGVALSSPMLIRIFKSESELEIWKEKKGAFELFATYPICHWSGSLGPKLRQGDKQAPEGFYTIAKKQLRHVGRWPRSLLINFPNILDQAEARTGSDILIHGGCTSVGCFAMTNPVADEIHRLSTAAIESGQDHMPIHIFPFRMSDDNVKKQTSAWSAFWANLKEGYDAFEKTRRAPRVSACDGRYTFSEAPGAANTGPLEDCGTSVAQIKEQNEWLDGLTANHAGPPPVRTAAADIQPMKLGAGSVTDVSADTAFANDKAPALTDAVTEAATVRPVFRTCRYALRVCRKTVSLAALQAARRTAMFSIGLRRVVLMAKPPRPQPGAQAESKPR
ncbi:MAG: L,D-transpeptidase family protein [Hyphomicrobium sp.]